MTQLAARKGIAERALEFTILTAARTAETIGAVWSEIDLDAKIWTIPAERMKADREHRVPLSGPAIAILRALPRKSDFVFPGRLEGRPLGHSELHKVLQRVRAGLTVHGLRSTFRDWAAERTAYPNHVVEMALAHAVGSAVEKAYRRGDLFAKRSHLMADWAKFCTTPQRDATVTPLHGRG
jgi:integrase